MLFELKSTNPISIVENTDLKDVNWFHLGTINWSYASYSYKMSKL